MNFEYIEIIKYCGPSFCLYICFIEYVEFIRTFQRGFEVLNVIFQVSVYVTIVTAIVHYDMYHWKKNFWYFISSWIVNM